MRWVLLIVLIGFWAISTSTPGLAQGFPVTAGEHDGFTRVVVHAPPGTQWSMDNSRRAPVLTVNSSAPLDLSRLFARIPRTRLTDARTESGTLFMTLACDCEVRSWEERAGLIVIDISDPTPEDEVALEMSPTPRQTELPDPQHLEMASLSSITIRNVGEELARQHVDDRQGAREPPVPETDFPRAALTLELGTSVAEALGQGLLEPAIINDAPDAWQLLDAPHPPVELPENMRVTTVTERADPNTPPEATAPEACRAADAFEFLNTTATEPFDEAFGRLSRSLYGEFDQPDPDVRRALIELYLSAGFGAEARALIGNQPDPVYGREFLLGLADVFEGRNSNSRMRVAQLIECEGPSSVVAALAGASPVKILAMAPSIALSFTGFDAPLRAIIGAQLATTMIDAGATEAARVVVGSTRRSEWVDPTSLDLIDAQLDRARGYTQDAVARLDYAQPQDPRGLLARLLLAIETQTPLEPSLLSDAEALASAERRNVEGLEIMTSVIRLHALAGSHRLAFSALDRIATWYPERGERGRLMVQLRNEIWTSLARTGDDTALMQLVLNRDDWRSPTLDISTRQALAARFLDLGLANPALSLLTDAQEPETTVLRARAFVELGNAEQALTLVAGNETEPARLVRAEALAALGQSERAAIEYETLSRTQDAASAAISAADWPRLERLGALETQADTSVSLDGIGRIFTQPPGYLNQPLGPQIQRSEDPPVGSIATNSPLSDPPAQIERQMVPIAPDEDVAVPQPRVAADPETFDFDRLGLVSRSATLLNESEQLREALSPLLRDASIRD